MGEVGVILPEAYSSEKAYPLMLCFGGGPQQRFNWEDWSARFFEVTRARGLARNWIFIAPIATEDSTFMDGDPLHVEIPRLCDALLKQYQVEGGKFHLAG